MQEPISFTEALAMEIARCEALLESGDATRMNNAAIRSAIHEAKDNLAKMERLGKKLVRSHRRLKEF